MEHITSLLANNCFDKCEGSWGSMINLATKTYQEHIDDITSLSGVCVYRTADLIKSPNLLNTPSHYEMTLLANFKLDHV